ncbi:MAG: dTDP-4-dehydrorhamnose reductase [Chlamydiae bacterium RIFCSPHIGHO2_12_FULL_49_9]|nr:MAG: dTDP-4-dehydrorhamnose reductase [Chlamydiae bacterium RIFCSPHIGHO2_12_FULL_49_9]
MKLWVTGASGLLGSALLAKAGGIGTNRKEADIADIESLRRFVKLHPDITHIVNCAAFSLVDLAETHKEEAYLANAKGPENLGRIASEIGSRLIHISTDYVFPGAGNKPLKEEDPTGPCNHYGKTKLEGEKLLLSAFPNACILRVSWLFGKGGKNFIARIMDLFKAQKEVRLTADQWGRPTFVPDLVQVILKMLDLSGLYQFANSGVTSKYEFGLALFNEARKMGFPLKAESILPVPGSTFPSSCKRPAYSAFDTSKIEKKLGVTPRHWQEALDEHAKATFI